MIKFLLGTTFMSGVVLGVPHAKALDLKIEMISVDTSNVTSSGEIKVVARILNLDATDFIGSLKVKPLLIPVQTDTASRFRLKGIGLPAQTVNVSLNGIDVQEIEFRSVLPTTPNGTYLIGANVNSNRAVQELSFVNNYSEDLIDCGALSANNPAGPGVIDFHSDTIFLNPRNGFANHSWRLFKTGIEAEGDFYASFFFVDVANKKLFDGEYEKSVYWVNSGSDFVAPNTLAPYDRYSNSPSFKSLKSGEYFLGTWANFGEHIVETDMSNNVDLQFLSVSRFRPLTESPLWWRFFPGDTTVQTQTATFVTDFESDQQWQIVAESIPVGVVISPMSGAFSSAASTVALSISVDPTLISSGFNSSAIQVLVNSTETVTFPIQTQVFTSNNLSFTTTPDLNFSAVKLSYDLNQTIQIENMGDEPLWFKIRPSTDWLMLSEQNTFEVGARQSRSVSVGASTRFLHAAASAIGYFEIMSSAQATPVNIPVTTAVLDP